MRRSPSPRCQPKPAPAAGHRRLPPSNTPACRRPASSSRPQRGCAGERRPAAARRLASRSATAAECTRAQHDSVVGGLVVVKRVGDDGCCCPHSYPRFRSATAHAGNARQCVAAHVSSGRHHGHGDSGRQRRSAARPIRPSALRTMQRTCLYASRVVVLASNGMCGRCGAGAGAAVGRSIGHCRTASDDSNRQQGNQVAATQQREAVAPALLHALSLKLRTGRLRANAPPCSPPGRTCWRQRECGGEQGRARPPLAVAQWATARSEAATRRCAGIHS